MLLINNIPIYNSPSIKVKSVENELKTQTDTLDSAGNMYSKLCCFLSTSSPITDSKEYKILTKVFEKLSAKIENNFIINIKSLESNDYMEFASKYDFSHFLFFGNEAILNNLPANLKINKSSFEQDCSFLLSENLVFVTETKDMKVKEQAWEAIKLFYKSII
jgi:hypothetical protein